MGGPNITGFLQLLDAQKEREQRITDAGKSAEYFVKSNPKVLDDMGVRPEQWTNLGAREKAAAIGGYVQNQAMQQAISRAKAETDFQTARTGEINQDMMGDQRFRATLERAQAPNAGAAGLVRNPMDGGPTLFDMLSPSAPAMRGLAGQRTLPPQQMLQTAMESGVRPERLGTMAGALARMQGQQEEDLTPGFITAPKTGAVFAYRGKQLLPAGVDPEIAQAAATPHEIHDDKGNLVGWMSTDVKGRSMVHPFKGGSKLPPATDSNGNEIVGFYVSPEGKIVDARTAIQKMTGAGPAGAAAKGGGATPDRVSVADKTGKKFTVPSDQLEEALKQGYTKVN